MSIWLALVLIITGQIVVYVILRPKLKSVQKVDEETKEYNQDLTQQKIRLETQREEIQRSIAELEKQADMYLNKNMELVNERFDTALEKAALKYQYDEEDYRNDYLVAMEDSALYFQNELSSKRAELDSLNAELEHLRAAVSASVEASKRANEMETQADFYRIDLSNEDIEEIRRLREVLPYLRDKEPLNKVIYKVYYENPFTDLIGRVLGSGAKTGIYKITNIKNNMCYVGQAANVADRWKQHVKRGVGAEPPTTNKLYPAMVKYGVENFTFELVEECERERLDEREDYWQEFFKAKEFGYSIK